MAPGVEQGRKEEACSHRAAENTKAMLVEVKDLLVRHELPHGAPRVQLVDRPARTRGRALDGGAHGTVLHICIAATAGGVKIFTF